MTKIGMEELMEQNVRPFGLRDKASYMFGDFGNDFTFIFASSFLMVFYTKVLGISGGMVGTLFLVARFVDAFTDVTMGRIVDAAYETDRTRKICDLDSENVRSGRCGIFFDVRKLVCAYAAWI